MNLSGCKNITSSFFLSLQKYNLLKNIEQLDVSGTSVCNNFIDILMRGLKGNAEKDSSGKVKRQGSEENSQNEEEEVGDEDEDEEEEDGEVEEGIAKKE